MSFTNNRDSLSSLQSIPTKVLQRRIDAAMGREECDLVLESVRYLDVFSCEWRQGDVAIYDGVIVGLESGLKAKRTIPGKGRTLVPGFIDAHVHVESSLLVPRNFEKAVLPKGTTTAICDPHELANVMGVEGIQFFLDAAMGLGMDLRVMLSSCVPATHFETNGGGEIDAEALGSLRSHPKALGLAEMMNVPGVLNADSKILEKLAKFLNGPIDGHCPLVSGRALSAYASVGISSCHESSRLEEAREKLTKGIAVWIREGSVAKDLETLIPLLSLATSTSVGFCTDDRNPLDIASEGHIDYLVRRAIQRGVPPEVVYRAASWSVARHYGLSRVGAIAPGYAADLVLLDDLETCSIGEVYKNGFTYEAILSSARNSGAKRRDARNTMQATVPDVQDLEGHSGLAHVIGVQSGKILTDHLILPSDASGVAKLSVLERYGRSSKPANAYVKGFGENLRGAIASSVGHDSHNLIVVGDRVDDMRVALASLIECGGGFCVVRDGVVLARLELPFGGLMSNEEPPVIESTLRELHEASQAIGCELPEPFLQLAFLSLPVIPSLKLTDQGLVDVEQFKLIGVGAY